MREIKFRAWDKRCNVMLYPDKENPSWVILKHKEMFDIIELMQFTGLKDKNGKEIFEGDVLKIHDVKGITADFICEVCWSEKELSWSFKEGLLWKRPTESMWAWILDKKLEIIGNKFENPELFKEED